jgi:aryl-phospho-beta-D-glucosidase BglC (GH1 family)
MRRFVLGFLPLSLLAACNAGVGGTGSDGNPPPTGDGTTPGDQTTNHPPGDQGGSGTSSKGYLHTEGNQIVDDQGQPVRLTGLSWFGMETANYAPHGLWSRSMGSMLDQIKSLGYNSIRVPFSNQLFDEGSTPNSIDLNQNPDLAGKKGIEILDKLVDGAKARGLRIILDRHRPDSGAQSALWYTDQYSEQRWIDDWKMLATRYAGDPTVVGFDLHNEPHGPATWGDGNPATDWQLAAEKAGNAVLAINPHLLIIVEGIETVNGSSYWWGGNLSAAGTHPVVLSVDHQLVYSPHDYPASVFAQTWFSAPDYPTNLTNVWESHWGYLSTNKTAPIWIGEFGTRDQTPSDQEWFKSITSYIGAQRLSFSYWCWNPDSGDTGGILQDDWQTINGDKQSVLQPLLAPLP